MGSTKQKRVGLLGGGFNPIHNQHIANALESYKQMNLDEIWFIPTKHHAFKGQIDTLDDIHRIHMIELAIQEQSNFKLEQIELESKETNYTVNTVRILKEKYPNTNFNLIIGGDNISSFHKWKDAIKLMDMVEIICCRRLGDSNKLDRSLSKYERNIHFLKMEQTDISSTFIRNALKAGESIRYYVPDVVYEYIKQHKLYE